MVIGILFDTVRRYLRYRDSVSCIAQLDERILRDIGVNRSELFAEAWTAQRRIDVPQCKRPAIASRAFA